VKKQEFSGTPTVLRIALASVVLSFLIFKASTLNRIRRTGVLCRPFWLRPERIAR